LRCNNIDQDFAKEEKDEGREKGKGEGKEGEGKERRQIHIPTHPPYVYERFFGKYFGKTLLT
jgi:hypothetical protein